MLKKKPDLILKRRSSFSELKDNLDDWGTYRTKNSAAL